MNKQKNFVSEMAQGLINSNNKWFEERKQARKDFQMLVNDLSICVSYIENRDIKSEARSIMSALNDCIYRM